MPKFALSRLEAACRDREERWLARWSEVSRALTHGPAPAEVTTDKAGPYLRVLHELVPAAVHVTEKYANNRIEADHGRLKARLRPMRGLKTAPLGRP